MSSVAEREEVEQALPEAGWHESYEDAMQKLKTLRETLVNRGKVYSSAIGQKTPPLWTLSREEIKALYDNGKGPITKQQAIDALARFH